jgi:hypothetical protein
MATKAGSGLVKQRRVLQKRAEIARHQDAVQKSRVKIAEAKAALRTIRGQTQ